MGGDEPAIMVPSLKARMRVKEYAVNKPIPDEQFTMEFPPGTEIYDEFVQLRIPSDIDMLEINTSALEAEIDKTALKWSEKFDVGGSSATSGIEDSSLFENTLKEAEPKEDTAEIFREDNSKIPNLMLIFATVVVAFALGYFCRNKAARDLGGKK